jgi:hypothetical protein
MSKMKVTILDKNSKDQLIDVLKERLNFKAGLCIDCKQPFSDKNVHTSAGWRETKISNCCEDCFDKMFGGENE